MPRTVRCPKCGAVLVANTPGGQCPRCLLSLAEEPDGAVAPSATQGQSAHRVHRFGDYELIEAIGHGGMGKVYRARQLSLKRIVALKMIHAGRFAGPEEVARFRREAEMAASLDHPNIVPIYEIGEHEEQQYFTMKLVEGQTLAQRSAKCGPRNAEWARRAGMLVAVVARALHYAHQRGVMHRDLKPANILLDARDEPLITDFGLARIIDSSVDLTRPEGMLGTLGYMAPEQLSGKPKDLTTSIDIHALGCILYELLTGRTPYQAETPAEAIRKLAAEEVAAPHRLNRQVDHDLSNICLKCVERRPEQRYSSAAALADDLDCWQQHRPIQARHTGPLERAVKWVRREPLKAGALVSIVLVALLTSVITSGILLKRLPHMAMQHAVASANLEGEFLLRVWPGKEDRLTENFWRYGFDPPNGQLLRLELLGVPPARAATLRFLIRADQPGRPDPARSPVLTNGQSFVLKFESDLDRNFYVASVGWSGNELLAAAPSAVVKLTLVTNKFLQTTLEADRAAPQ